MNNKIDSTEQQQILGELTEDGTVSDFERRLIALVNNLIDVSAIRFHMYMPSMELSISRASANTQQDEDVVDEMERVYQKTLWLKDPMHPSRFEKTDTKVITNTQLMPTEQWLETDIYKSFLKKSGYVHDADIFFRHNDVIIGVLTLLRTELEQPFTDSEVAVLEAIQPFVQFTLNRVYLPARISQRKLLADLYQLTERELDVVEYALTGVGNKELSAHLKISVPTLRTHLQHIYTKVEVNSTGQLLAVILPKISPISNKFDTI